jgi:uncharacterized protein
MEKETLPHKIRFDFLIKIIIGIAAVVTPVWLIESASQPFLQKFNNAKEVINGMVSISVSAAAVGVYILLFRFYEKRNISELSSSSFIKNSLIGFTTGLLLQFLFVFVLYLMGYYRILSIHPASDMLPALFPALTAGFVAEIIIRGIIFRILEEKYGTVITICFMILLFAVLHAGGKNSNILTMVATVAQAGFMVSASYVYCRNLWLPIFLHFAWDFAEPGIFGAINPGNRVDKSLFSSELTGPHFLTGGQSGPQNSLQAAVFCLLTGLVFLWLAKRKNHFISYRTQHA